MSRRHNGRSLRETGLWRDVAGIPSALAATLEQRSRILEGADFLRRDDVARVLTTGNGASLYAAQAWANAAAWGPTRPFEVVAIPGEWAGDPGFPWREGDRLVIVSTSGELRDGVAALEHAPRPILAITGHPASTIGSGVDAIVEVRTESQHAFTHTQSFVANVAALVAMWATITDDRHLLDLIEELPEHLATSLTSAPEWAIAETVDGNTLTSGIAAAPKAAQPAAMEASLLLKELALIPTEGMDVREAATTGLYAAGEKSVFVSIPCEGVGPQIVEAELLAAERGAEVVRLPGGIDHDHRVGAITTFPHAVALAATIGLGKELDIDQPPWIDGYLRSARPTPDRSAGN